MAESRELDSYNFTTNVRLARLGMGSISNGIPMLVEWDL